MIHPSKFLLKILNYTSLSYSMTYFFSQRWPSASTSFIFVHTLQFVFCLTVHGSTLNASFLAGDENHQVLLVNSNMNDSAIHTDAFASVFQKHSWKCHFGRMMGWQQIFGDVMDNVYIIQWPLVSPLKFPTEVLRLSRGPLVGWGLCLILKWLIIQFCINHILCLFKPNFH